MRIWSVPVGQVVDLGPARGRGLLLASHALARVAATVDVEVSDISWYAGRTADAAALRLALVHRDNRSATLRLYTVDSTGTEAPLADLRHRRGNGRPGPDLGPLVATPVRPGDSIRRRYQVTGAMVTDHVPGRAPVLTTPDLISLIEHTAADLLRPRFAAGTSAVGTWIGVRHTGPASVGEEVEVCATVADVSGRRVTFDVRAGVGARDVGDGQVTQTLIRAAG